MRKLIGITIIVLFFFQNYAFAQGWIKSYGTTAVEYGEGLVKSFDGGYFLLGSSFSSGVYLIKTDINGDTIWTRYYGGAGSATGYSMSRDVDEGLLIVGRKFNPTSDVYFIKTDKYGDSMWTKTYGGPNTEFGNWVEPTNDKGYIITGMTRSYGQGMDDIYIIKTDSIGDTLWTRTFGDSTIDFGYSCIQTKDNGFIVGGSLSSSPQIYVVKLDSIGDTIWTRIYGYRGSARFIIEPKNGGYLVVADGSVISPVLHDVLLIRINDNGDTLWTNTYLASMVDYVHHGIQTKDNGFMLIGHTGSFGAGGQDIYAIKTDSSGNLQWTRTYGGINEDYGKYVLESDDGGYVIVGSSENFGAGNFDVVLIKTDSFGYALTNELAGNVYNDNNSNCIKDSLEKGKNNILIRVDPGPWYTLSDTGGNYSILVDTGNYTVTQILPNELWKALCPVTNNYTVNLNSHFNVLDTLDFADTIVRCPIIEVDMSTNRIRTCSENKFYVNYCNSGTDTAFNIILNLQFDSLVNPISASLPWDTIISGTYKFNIGTVLPGECNTFYVIDSISCLANVGDTICINSFITPSLSCIGIDTSLYQTSYNYCRRVVGSWDPNEKIVISPDSKPANYFINKNETIYYQINFQNTGTDTAYSVAIIDTLSSYLEVESVMNLTSSHTNNFRIFGQGILEWSFTGINLPDSNTNYENSQGFVKYKVQIKNASPHLAIINNSASITFDNNLPIKTNLVFNTICKNPISNFNHSDSNLTVNFSDSSDYALNWSWDFGDGDTSSQQEPSHTYASQGTYNVCLTVTNACSGTDSICDSVTVLVTDIKEKAKNNITISPNPFSSSTEIVIAAKPATVNPKLAFSMYDILGREVQQFRVTSSGFQVHRGSLPEGLYFFRINSEEGVLGSGKLVIQD